MYASPTLYECDRSFVVGYLPSFSMMAHLNRFLFCRRHLSAPFLPFFVCGSFCVLSVYP
jgi:hypothetical protein